MNQSSSTNQLTLWQDFNMALDYGKRITTESFHDGKQSNCKVEMSIPIMVADKTQALTELMKALELITNGQTFQINIRIDADPYNHQLKKITTQYVVQ